MRVFSLIAVGAAVLGTALLSLRPAAAGALPGLKGDGAQQQQQPHMACELLELSLKTNVNSYRGTYAGKGIVLTGRVRNTGDVAMDDVAVGFHLPADGGLCRTKAALYPNPRTQEVLLRTDGGANIYWEGFTLGGGKWRKFELYVEVSAALAAEGGNLEVAAVAYRLDEKDGGCVTMTEPETVLFSAVCHGDGSAGGGRTYISSSSLIHPNAHQITVHPLAPHKTASNSATAICTADLPEADARRALAVAAENQRCGDADEMPVSDVRRPAQHGVRRLGTVVTQETCWAQCSESGLQPPFYMSVVPSAQGSRCFWCVRAVLACVGGCGSGCLWVRLLYVRGVLTNAFPYAYDGTQLGLLPPHLPARRQGELFLYKEAAASTVHSRDVSEIQPA